MVAPFLGNEEIQREEAQEDSNGCEGRGSKELGTEGRDTGSLVTSPPGLGVQPMPLCPVFI